MPYSTLPIVGAHFRPPAKVLIEALAIGTPLFLFAEPDNAYDPNAIAVFLRSKNIPEASHDLLNELLPRSGHSLDMVLSQEEWHLGYIPKEFAAQLRTTETIVTDKYYDVSFSTSTTGAPRVRFLEPVL